MHPMIKPALRRSWRGRHTVQMGVTRAHAVSIQPVDAATGLFLRRLDGTRGLDSLRREAHRFGLSARSVDTLVARLTRAGLIDEGPPAPKGTVTPRDDHPTSTDRPRRVHRSPGAGLVAPAAAGPGGPSTSGGRRPGGAIPARLRGDQASLSVVHPEPGAAVERLRARRGLRVVVRGAGRVGASVAALLSAAGVGGVEVVDGGCVEPWDVTPGGVGAGDVGRRRRDAALGAVRRAGPWPAARGGAAGGAVSLVVLAPRDGLAAYAPDPEIALRYRAAGVPHVYAGVLEGTGVVGPLVLPGGSACAGCLAAARAEREPEWPRMLAQWRAGGDREGVAACDVALATMVAGLTAAHALTFLDGRLPVCTGARLEFALPGLAWELTELDPHPRCGCGAAAAADRDTGVAHV
ncbi:ThiF family adenylyltransferase [Streptomyces sp. WMMC500]|uniref:ThiF family adenylyltransferase n=1 Tax=Streptomyces sp. WMMC500 TaxID=3015154 RepID=UPI00248B606F|nr:ThiF family adenylyltransferase [Streptomyces sp. WMMC500]WBB63246.1 ThiF family adenylyltransferase [Streptomyces sp. WMMC500]